MSSKSPDQSSLEKQELNRFVEECIESMYSPDECSPHEVAFKYKVSIDTVYITALDEENRERFRNDTRKPDQ